MPATLAVKLAYGFMGLFSVAAVGGVTGVIPVQDWVNRFSVQQEAQEPAPAAPLVGETSMSEPVVEPETETALVIPQSPVLDGAPVVPAPAIEPTIPAFDLLRVEPDGSVVIAGTAAPDARVEAFSGNIKLGEAKAAANGDFVIVFDDRLEPGDYEIVLRADAPDGTSATSTETAIVSMPERGDDGVLALVEEPGAPSRLITAGEAAAEPLMPVQPKPEPEPQPDTPVATAIEPPPEPEVAAPALPALTSNVRIEAVEIDGDRLFVAGAATPGSRLNVYANDILLGTTTASAGGRFLIEVNRDLPVGDYMIRADVLADNGVDVVMRAAVPFVRQPGEQLAAVAVAQAPQLPAGPPVLPEGQAGSIIVPQALGQLPAQVPLPTTQQALQPVDRSVIIRRGDTLWQISRRVYGRGIKYTTIYLANTDQIRDPDRIWPGQVFALPEDAEDG